MTSASRFELAPDTRIHLLQGDSRTAPPAELVVADNEVSRSHCRVELRNGEALVTDLGSTNGAYVNGERRCRRG
jgi:pSer/pThr/pTyr-binding forkhead associated (FHA) protein